MNKGKKIMTVLMNYRSIIETKKTNIIKDIKGLEDYKKELEIANKIVFSHIGSKVLNNNLFTPSASLKDGKDVELFVLNPNTNNVRMLELLSEASAQKDCIIIVIYQENSLQSRVLDKLSQSKNIQLIPFLSLGGDSINQVICSTFMLANIHMNILKHAKRFYLSTNLMPFEIKRTQIAPINDDKLDLEKNMLSNVKLGAVQTFVPTHARWLQNIFEGYIYLKIKKIFVDLEIASKMQEIVKANQSLDILREKIEEIGYELQMNKIKSSSDELSILQGDNNDH